MTRLVVGAAAVAFAGVSAASAQIVMDFDEFEFNDGGNHDIGTSISEDGFTITEAPDDPFQFAVFGQLEARYPGSAAPFNNSVGGLMHLEADNGSAFNLLSIALAPLNSPGSVTVNFTGTLDGGGTVTQSFTTSGNAIELETFSFNGFNNVVSVEWLQEAPFHQFDQITIVPAPGALALLGLGTLAGVRRRRH